MNPLTHRTTTPAQQNGVGAHSKNSPQKPFANQEVAAIDKHAHDRLVYLYGNAMVRSEGSDSIANAKESRRG